LFWISNKELRTHLGAEEKQVVQNIFKGDSQGNQNLSRGKVHIKDYKDPNGRKLIRSRQH
jgi:hypothetical protein